MPVDLSDEATVNRLVKLLGERFVVRKDVKAEQWDNGAWSPVREHGCQQFPPQHKVSDCPAPVLVPMKMHDFKDHLSGRRTLGYYLLGADSTTKLFVLDIDLRKPSPEWDPGFNPRDVWNGPDNELRQELCVNLRGLADGLAMRINRLLECPVAIADSGGKGLHVYAFTGQRPAEVQRQLAHEILASLGSEPTRGENFWRTKYHDSRCEIEVFPKQNEVGEEGFGNLLRFPLGVNRKTGRWSSFIRCDAPLNALVPMDPMAALEGELPWD